MARFSEKYGFSSPNQEIIIESAPIWLRIAFYQDILDNYLNRQLYTMSADDIDILDSGKLINKISIIYHRDVDEKVDLLRLIKEIPWFEFYDIIEIIGELIKDSIDEWDRKNFEEDYSSALRSYDLDTYSRYIEQVNKFFRSNKVSWRLDENCTLHLALPQAVFEKYRAAKNNLINSRITQS
jgi:hypothetical protein